MESVPNLAGMENRLAGGDVDIMIVEDSGLVRSSLKRALAAVPELRLVTEAEDGSAALAALKAATPDLVLVNLSLCSTVAASFLSQVRRTGYGGWIVVLTDMICPPFCDSCMEMGADAVLDQSLEFDKLVDELRAKLPPRPANEAARLLLLNELQVLDTPEEPVFDDLVRQAASMLDTPIALFSLVDEFRQWFKARHGLDARETSRTIAFCAHAINGNDLFVVEDAWEDPRFSANPLVRGAPHIRFYAGMPLVMPNGEVLGTLCVIDRKPRTLSESQALALRFLAHRVLTELNLRLGIQARGTRHDW